MASKRGERRRMCGQKKGYPTEAAAKYGLRGLLKDKPSNGWWMAVYRCRFCGLFHFGHAPKS